MLFDRRLSGSRTSRAPAREPCFCWTVAAGGHHVARGPTGVPHLAGAPWLWRRVQSRASDTGPALRGPPGPPGFLLAASSPAPPQPRSPAPAFRRGRPLSLPISAIRRTGSTPGSQDAFATGRPGRLLPAGSLLRVLPSSNPRTFGLTSAASAEPVAKEPADPRPPAREALDYPVGFTSCAAQASERVALAQRARPRRAGMWRSCGTGVRRPVIAGGRLASGDPAAPPDSTARRGSASRAARAPPAPPGRGLDGPARCR